MKLFFCLFFHRLFYCIHCFFCGLSNRLNCCFSSLCNDLFCFLCLFSYFLSQIIRFKNIFFLCYR